MLGIIRNGRLTRDPEQRDVGGTTVTKMTVAENTTRKDPSTGETITMFINCSVWGKQGDNVCKFLAKGDPVAVVGEYYDREYADKQTGEKRISRELNALEVTFLPKPKRDEQTDDKRSAAKASPAQTSVDDDELPF